MNAFIKTTLIIALMVVGSVSRADNSEIQQVLDRYVTSINTLDMDLAGQIWSQSEDVSFIQPRGHQKGWKQVKENFYLGAMMNFSKRELQLKDISIRMLGEDTAWTNFYWDFYAVFSKNGKEIHTQGRETQVLHKDKDGWKIVHIHYSGPATQREGEGF